MLRKPEAPAASIEGLAMTVIRFSRPVLALIRWLICLRA